MSAARSRFTLPQISSTAAKLALALVAVSVIGAIGGESVRSLLLLTPGRVVQNLWLWQPITYSFVATDPLGVIFGAIILWSIGGSLEASWRSRRVLTFAIGSSALAGLCTVALGLLFTTIMMLPYPGGTVMTTALWVAYGFSVGSRQTNFWGLPLTGNVLALIGIGFVFLSGAFGSWYRVVPEAFAILFAYLYTRGLSPRVAWLRFQSWRLERQLKMRSKHLKLVSKDRNTRSDSDRFLH